MEFFQSTLTLSTSPLESSFHLVPRPLPPPLAHPSLSPTSDRPESADLIEGLFRLLCRCTYGILKRSCVRCNSEDYRCVYIGTRREAEGRGHLSEEGIVSRCNCTCRGRMVWSAGSRVGYSSKTRGAPFSMDWMGLSVVVFQMGIE